MEKKHILLRIISLVVGIVLIVLFALQLFKYFRFLFYSDFDFQFLFGLYGLIPIVAGIFLIKGSKKLKKGEIEVGLKILKIGSILLFVTAFFPFIDIVTNLEYMDNITYIMAQAKHLLVPLCYPIFFFVFRKKLPTVNRESAW